MLFRSGHMFLFQRSWKIVSNVAMMIREIRVLENEIYKNLGS